MPELLTNLYKLMDDIYDSVKRTAYGTTKAYLQVSQHSISMVSQNFYKANCFLCLFAGFRTKYIVP